MNDVEIIAAIVLYLIGCVVSYRYGRNTYKRLSGMWTIGDRNNELFFSLFSWIAVWANYMGSIHFDKANEKEANW